MLLDHLLPSPCVLCQKLGSAICQSCLAKLQFSPAKINLGDLTGFYFSDYDQPISVLLNSVKEQGITSLIGPMMSTVASDWPLDSAILVPIPSSKANALRRGFSHTHLYVRNLSRKVAGVKVSDLLISVGRRKDQLGLDLQSREQNMAGAFAIRLGKALEGKYWLFDDVLTTGATIRAAATALGEGGVAVAGFCVIARVKPQNG